MDARNNTLIRYSKAVTSAFKPILRNQQQAEPAASVYVHVPFCPARCRYCDFCSSVYDRATASATVDAILRELDARSGELSTEPLATVFVGGGTPTSLPAEQLTPLLSALASRCGPDTEFTVEANPATLDIEMIRAMRDHRVNRLSIGVQSFCDKELDFLGRLHDADGARRAVALAKQGGVETLSLDLMYGLPGQDPGDWDASLDKTLSLGVDHVSSYCLSIEPETPLHAELQAGLVTPMEDDAQREMYERAIARLKAAGLAQYEISNFARPGCECRHNIGYWQSDPYVGIGPSAASYIGGVRMVNTSEIKAYGERIGAGESAQAFSERLFGRKKAAEMLMLALRMRGGVNRSAFRSRVGVDPLDLFPVSLGRSVTEGLCEMDDHTIRLTEAAQFISNAVFADLFAEADATADG